MTRTIKSERTANDLQGATRTPVKNVKQSDVDLGAMTKSELLQFAAENGVSGVSGMKKDELLNHLKNL